MTKRLELEVDRFFKTWDHLKGSVYIVNPRTDSQLSRWCLINRMLTRFSVPFMGWEFNFTGIRFSIGPTANDKMSKGNWLILWRNKWVARKIDVFLLKVWAAFTAPFLWLPIMRAMRPRGKGGARHPWLPALFPPNALHYAMYELRRMQVAIWTSQII